MAFQRAAHDQIGGLVEVAQLDQIGGDAEGPVIVVDLSPGRGDAVRGRWSRLVVRTIPT